MFNFKLGDTIYYIRENKLHSARIWTRMGVENAHDDWAHTKEQRDTWQHFGPSRVAYVTCDGVVMQDEAYESPEVLAVALVSKVHSSQ